MATAAQTSLLEQAVTTLRRLVADRPPAGTLHFGLFALARLLEQIARQHPDSGHLPDGILQAALEIARHVADHGVALAPTPHTTREPVHEPTQETR